MCAFRYRLVRSGRKTLALQITPQGEIVVRAPMKTSMQKIDSFVAEHAGWIHRHLSEQQSREAEPDYGRKLAQAEITALRQQAETVIPGRVRYYADKLGVSYGRITIRGQKTRWGSCSSRGDLNFNYLLMLAPPDVLDSVVAHELCHRKQMNHSERFYAELYGIMPDYDNCHNWLKKHGQTLLSRL